MKSFYVLILILVASFVSVPVQAVTAKNYEKGTKAQQKSISYLSCAFYGSSTQLDPSYTEQVPTADIKILQKAASTLTTMRSHTLAMRNQITNNA